jgi:outer membrane protein OmpA-like peptidoglycan-associated protein
MSSLLDSLEEQTSPDLIRGLASDTGESGDAVQKALQGGSAAMLATLASKAQEPGFLSQIMNLISSFSTRSAMGATAGGGSSAISGSAQAGSTFLNMLFGNNLSGIQNKIAEFSSLRVSSAGSILSMAAPMVLGTLASKVNSEGLSASGLGNLITAELPSLRSFLPAGLSIRGPSHPRRQKVRRRSSVTSRVSHVAEGVRPTTPKWLWPVVLAVLFIGALLWFANRNTSSVNTVNTAATASSNAAAQASNAASNAAGSLGAFVKAAIPGGVDLNIPENGMENRLLVYIKDPNAKVSRETWFEFDRLNFDTGLANLQLSSQEEQLENIAKILKAYPNVHVRIDGYTDNQGDAAANLKLSQDRANAVMAHLIALSVDPFRIDAKGYGEDHPVADNSTEEGRARNRRIALRVTQK